jgi:hypothetical protein
MICVVIPVTKIGVYKPLCYCICCSLNQKPFFLLLLGHILYILSLTKKFRLPVSLYWLPVLFLHADIPSTAYLNPSLYCMWLLVSILPRDGKSLEYVCYHLYIPKAENSLWFIILSQPIFVKWMNGSMNKWIMLDNTILNLHQPGHCHWQVWHSEADVGLLGISI